MRVVRPRPHADDGAVAVEFALVSLVLFPLLFGIVQYGWFFYQQGAAASTARDAARLAAVGIDSCSTFKTAVKTRAGANGTPTGGSWNVTTAYSNANPQRVTDTITVTITWSPTKFGFPVPFVSGALTAQAQAAVESVGQQTGNC